MQRVPGRRYDPAVFQSVLDRVSSGCFRQLQASLRLINSGSQKAAAPAGGSAIPQPGDRGAVEARAVPAFQRGYGEGGQTVAGQHPAPPPQEIHGAALVAAAGQRKSAIQLHPVPADAAGGQRRHTLRDQKTQRFRVSCGGNQLEQMPPRVRAGFDPDGVDEPPPPGAQLCPHGPPRTVEAGNR